MKRTSKKLLSFFLAVVMVVTSCSVGFTAFAQEKDGTYWNNTTDIKDAYQSINEVVDYLVPVILGIEVGEQKIGDLLGIEDIDNATLKNVVEGASPLLLGLLAKSDETVEDFMVRHASVTGISTWKDKYNRYYSYLAGSKDDKMSFYDLYTFCENNKNDKNADFAKYCSDTIESLNTLIKICANAEADYVSKSNAADTAYNAIRNSNSIRTKINAGSTSVQDLGELELNGVKIKNLPLTETKDGKTVPTAYQTGIEICNTALEAAGVDLRATNPAEALAYYYVGHTGYSYNATNATQARAINYASALLYLKLAEEGGKPIQKAGVDVTISNYKTILGAPATAGTDYQYYAKAIYGLINSYTPAATIDCLSSPSYEAINAAVLAREGSLGDITAVKDAIEAAKITPAQIAEVEATAKENDWGGHSDKMLEYLASDDCVFSSYAVGLLQRMNANDFSMLCNAFAGVSDEGYTGATYPSNALATQSTFRTYAGYVKGNAAAPVVDVINAIISGAMTNDIIGSGKYIQAAQFLSKPSMDIIEIGVYSSVIQPATANAGYSYTGSLVIPEQYSVEAVNGALNSTVGGILDPETETGALVSSLIGGLMESDIDLPSLVKDIWLNLYEKPIETVMNLLPTLIILVDEVLVPLVFNGDSDATHGSLTNALLGDPTTLLGGLTFNAGNVEVGLNTLNFDLNKLLPALLYWINGDAQKAIDLVGTYGDYLDANSFDVERTNNMGDVKETYIEDGKEKTRIVKVLNSAPMITGIYVADLALAGINIDFITEKLAEKMDADLATGLTELISTIIDVAIESIEDFEEAYGDEVRYGIDYVQAPTISQKGLNNVLVALPRLLDCIGKNLLAQFDVESDWTTIYDGKFENNEKTFNANEEESKQVKVTQVYNAGIEKFKSYAEPGNQNPEAVFGMIVDLIVSLGINGVIDLLNDIFSTENAITSDLKIVADLINSLGGFGEKSIITDVLNGLFTLTREDEASFTLSKNEKTGFVGLSTESALFLIANLNLNGKGLVPLIAGIIEGNKISGDNEDPEEDPEEEPEGDPEPTPEVIIGAPINTAALLKASTVDLADEAVAKLDKVLHSLLANTSLNGLTLTSNSNIINGALSTVINLIGESNTEAALKILDEVNDVAVSGETAEYSNKNLSKIITDAYKLIEDVVDYLFYESDNKLIPHGDDSRVIAGAITGIISPDSVAVRMSDDYSKAKKALAGKTSWQNVKNIDFGIAKSGNKEEFFKALGQSMSSVAAIVSALLAYSATGSANDSLYAGVVYPVLNSVAGKFDIDSVLAPSTYAMLNAQDQFSLGIVAPVADVLANLYDAPASFLLNFVAGLGALLDDATIKDIIDGVTTPVGGIINNLAKVVTNNLGAPSLAQFLLDATSSITDLSSNLPEKDIIVGLLGGISIAGVQIGSVIDLKSIEWKKLGAAKTPGEVLTLVYGYISEVVLKSELVQGALEALVPDLATFVKELDLEKLLTLLNDAIDSVNSPTEIYWTFKQYAGKITNTFVYPKGITASEAETAVTSLDALVENVFPLLKSLGVADIDGLGALVNDNLYTNSLLTTMAKGIYGAIYKLLDENDLTQITDAIGLDVSTTGIANILMDSSYGNTYSSAASALKAAGSWDKVTTLNWGFKDGSAKAQAGFINGVAAILRPLNNILTIFLADGAAYPSVSEIADMLSRVNLAPISVEAGNGNLYISLQNGIFTLEIDSPHTDENSVVKVNLGAIATEIELGNIRTNGYESAIIPLLEAFLCDNVKTYSQYLADYSKAKDNLLIDVLTPIFGVVNKLVDAPATTLTETLPNIAYFISSNGIAQVLNNLLAPLTAENGLIGVITKAGLNIDDVLASVLGKPLGKVITDAIGIDANLNLELTNLLTLNIQDIVLPLVRSLLAKYGIDLYIPDFSFATIASHGTIQTVASAARNADGQYLTKRVVANKGETLVAVLRYVADVLIKNANAINKLLGGIDAIKKNATIKNILDCVFASIRVATPDDIVRAIFYFLSQSGSLNVAEDAFFDFSKFITKAGNFSFGEMDEDFCRKLAPMLDGLINGLLEGGLNKLIGDLIYKDDIISSLVTGLYGAIEGVKVGSLGSLTSLLAQTGIDFSTANVAALLTDKEYGNKYAGPANVIKKAGSWKKVNKASLSWGVTDRDSFVHALAAALRPLYGVLDVILNNSRLNLFNVVQVAGSDGYTSFIVPLLEAFSCYNIKTQYDYRMDMDKEYDAILIDILNPLLDKVEDILYAPVEMVADILPNLSLFFANDGLLQLLDNLLTPISALLDAIKPIINVNNLLKVLGVNLNSLLSGIGIKANVKLDIYNLKETLSPLISAENVVSLLNGILGSIKIKGNSLGIVLPEIDWFALASHGTVVKATSQVATWGDRIYVQADQDETLIAVLRFVINTINYQNNYNAIVGLLGGLLGGLSESIAGVIDEVLGMLQGDADTVIGNLVELLQSIAG